MPLMTKIRESLATFFSIFAGVFVIYIVLDWGMDITGRQQSLRLAESQEVGKINDQAVLSKDYAEFVRRAIENQKTQTGNDPNEDQQRIIRDQIWDYLIDQKLYEDEITRLNITVPDQEIIDWVKGDNPPEFLRKNFIDSTGVFNRQQYEAALQDPRNKPQLVQAEGELKKQRQREKLQSLILSSVRVTEYDILQKFLDQNIKYEADYILLDPMQLVKDDEITVTEDDLRAYYSEHAKDFKSEATRKLKYVRFNMSPTKNDTDIVVGELEDIAKRVTAGADFVELAKTYSEIPTPDAFFKHGELSQDKEIAIFKSKIGDVAGPIKEIDGYHLMKILEFRDGKDEFVHASHILVSIENNDSVAALKKAKEILAEVKQGKDFSELAGKYSNDPGSGARGGDLGWFGKGRMVKPFEDAVYKAKPGQIIGPVKTQFGFHIIKVFGRDKREVKISDIHMIVRVSSTTSNEVAQRAQDFAYLAKEGNFLKEAELSKYTVTETQPFQKNAVIPGIGTNIPVNKFAFNNDLNSVSEAFFLQNGYGVFMITEIKESGTRPFDELKTYIENQVNREKKIEKIRALATELKQSLAPGEKLQAIPTKRPNFTVEHLEPFSVEGAIPTIGRDMGFIGGLTALHVGEISKPVEGLRGMYLIQLVSKTSFDSTMYNTQKNNIRNQLLSDKANQFFSEWTGSLKKSAEIIDNRDLFYR
ncbi:MAG TPA: peptidylprolyl isomerase [Bacteroidota bacterium]|nr:peptidylprolyl isomerase [Bacteroidota bacterium]